MTTESNQAITLIDFGFGLRLFEIGQAVKASNLFGFCFMTCSIEDSSNETATLLTDIILVQQPLLGRPDHPGGGLLPRPPPMQFGGRPPMQNDMGPPGGIPSLLGPPPPMPFRMMPPGGE